MGGSSATASAPIRSERGWSGRGVRPQGREACERSEPPGSVDPRELGSRVTAERAESSERTRPLRTRRPGRRRRSTPGGTSSRRGRPRGRPRGPASLRFGRMTSVRPARWAARTFCLRPPIGRTAPCSVISPVMPTVSLTGRSRSRLTERRRHGDARRRAVLGHGAGRHVDVEPAAHGVGVDAELGGVRAHVVEGDLRRLLHDVAELAGEGQARLGVGRGRERRRLDEQHVAAVAR